VDALPSGPIPPFLDMEASLLPPKNEEIFTAVNLMLAQTVL
jgi:hypothetical protein